MQDVTLKVELVAATLLLSMSCGGLAANDASQSSKHRDEEDGGSDSANEDGSDDSENEDPLVDPQQGSDGDTVSNTDRQFTTEQVEICFQIGAIEEKYWAEYREIESWPQEPFDPSQMEAPPLETEWPETPCFYCRETCRDQVEAGTCSHISACVERHCLCEDCSTARIDGQSMCDCVELCMPEGQNVCRDYWDDVMSCRAEACLSVCE